MKRALLLITLIILISGTSQAQQKYSFKIAKLKYSGGGDWYANKTSLPNLIRFCNQNLNMNIAPEEAVVEVGSPELFSYPFVHMTGHGNVVFSDAEAQNLRNYLISGGFLHIDDNYGLDQYIRKEMKKVFPEYELVELPFDHPIYRQKYTFKNGLPKIHEHDNKPPQGFGIIHKGRLVCFYSYETDLGNGWEDTEVHNDPENKRQEALQMGANILAYALTQYL
ncbi:DUF4159 domain-containing protein [Pontibacter sp. JH31]|uniref:DUF4159 domain-containing protein n=1 Tax=Pontibacter aquaedesilientis TaxID=2766980 RepID=A0ABR7XDA2_9BACT|nr:DUF4159 domain-containing protein [Pontibacter aquaedesilientis]MBD1396272.1 DUF4159 domain-containing protein [Pontibacter aquaedesilientis]